MLIKKILNYLMVSTIIISTAGCATIFSGSTQTINVKAVDSSNGQALNNVSCNVIDGTGSMYHVSSNPGQITISKARGNITINCTKENFTQLNTAVGDSFNSVTLVNILFWPGFIVDALTGAYKELPSHFVVSMKKVDHYN